MASSSLIIILHILNFTRLYIVLYMSMSKYMKIIMRRNRKYEKRKNKRASGQIINMMKARKEKKMSNHLQEK